MDQAALLNQIAYDLETLYRQRDPQFVAIRVQAPFFPSPIMGEVQQLLIDQVAARGLTLCRAPRSYDALVYSNTGDPPQGKVVSVPYSIPFGVSF